MAAYTRQSTFTDGDTIFASLLNNEYDQLAAAFNVSTGHTHDGSTTGDGGPISKLFSNTLTFGTNTNNDISVTMSDTAGTGTSTAVTSTAASGSTSGGSSGSGGSGSSY